MFSRSVCKYRYRQKQLFEHPITPPEVLCKVNDQHRQIINNEKRKSKFEEAWKSRDCEIFKMKKENMNRKIMQK